MDRPVLDNRAALAAPCKTRQRRRRKAVARLSRLLETGRTVRRTFPTAARAARSNQGTVRLRPDRIALARRSKTSEAEPSPARGSTMPFSASDRITVENVETLSDNWCVLRNYTFRYRRRDGSEQRLSRECYDRGNGAVILLYNSTRNSLILTREFRMPA